MIVDVGQGRTPFASASDRPAAIHVRVEARVARTFSAPAHTADLEHANYFTAGAAGGTTGEDTRWTTPLNASSIETL